MPECIVCKGYYSSGTMCPRCGSDNERWIKWQQEEPVEQGGFRGLLLFAGLLPLLVIEVSVAFGLIFLTVLWRTIKAPVGLLAVTVTLVGNLIIVFLAYVDRYRIRERELLAQVRTTIGIKRSLVRLSPQLKALLVPMAALGLVLLVVLALVMFDMPWALIQWVLLEPSGAEAAEQFPQLGRFKERLVEALPLILMIAYVICSLALTHFCSVLSAQEYAGRMNRALPQPIFLQGDLLARVVKREAEKYLCQIAERPPTARQSPGNAGESPQTGHSSDRDATREYEGWTWVDLERTSDGGIKFLARAECEDSQVEESITGHRTKFPEFVSYAIEADRWGRIVRVARGERTPQY